MVFDLYITKQYTIYHTKKSLLSGGFLKIILKIDYLLITILLVTFLPSISKVYM